MTRSLPAGATEPGRDRFPTAPLRSPLPQSMGRFRAETRGVAPSPGKSSFKTGFLPPRLRHRQLIGISWFLARLSARTNGLYQNLRL
ncbi:hypothetical protein [Phormidium sp. CCY1219]|uniref:hypothetical protein n=1 Tax=Phormidium sp. CCY1219 TaxID=2886104 RepID=UPI002D1F0CB1|nr:hypothetical protein [Phormidium sp. CCY1219]MEB3829602.1 hypothetical protein [Phormidium sp. CCY1219]